MNRPTQAIPFRLNRAASDDRLLQPIVTSHLASVIRFRSLILCSLYKTVHGPSIARQIRSSDGDVCGNDVGEVQALIQTAAGLDTVSVDGQSVRYSFFGELFTNYSG